MSLKHWYLVYTKPRQETVARRNLGRQGYETYLPRIRQTRRRGGRRVSVVGPMFPRYLFVHLDTEQDNWAPIRSTLGVVSIVRFGREPARVPKDLVQTLRGHEDKEGIQVLPSDEFKTGSRIRMVEGSFVGYEGIFLARTSKERVLVLLDVLGHHTRAKVSTGAIEPA